MSDATWTALGFAAIAANLLALVGHEALRKPGEFSVGALPFALLTGLCGIWAWEDDRPAVRGALVLLALASLVSGLWTRGHLRRGVVQSRSPEAGDGDAAVKPVLIYTMTHCPFCLRAKELLRSKGVEFEEVDLDLDGSRWEECERLSGRETVPQVFIGGKHVGGCDDLLALEASGELDRLLRA